MGLGPGHQSSGGLIPAGSGLLVELAADPLLDAAVVAVYRLPGGVRALGQHRLEDRRVIFVDQHRVAVRHQRGGVVIGLPEQVEQLRLPLEKIDG